MSKRIKINFSSVGEGRGEMVPPGDYVVKVKDVEFVKKSKTSGKPKLTWTFEVISPAEQKGSEIRYHSTSLQPQALFNLRNLLLAGGMKVPKDEVNLDLEQMKTMVLGVSVDEEEYTGSGGMKKKRPVIVDYFGVQKKGKKYEKVDDIPEEDEVEEDDEEDDEDLEEIDMDDL